MVIKYYKGLIALFMMAITIFCAMAADFNPGGNITGRGIYSIYNFTDIKANNVIYESGASLNSKYNDTAFCSAIVDSVGNWSNDKSSYLTATQSNNKFLQNVSCASGYVMQNATVLGSQCIPITSLSNTTFNQTLTDGLYYGKNSNTLGFYNSTTLPAYPTADNTSWNESYADTKYLTSVPYQSSAAGWTNTSTMTSTDLNVNVTSGNLTVINGNVGIGVASPQYALTINSSVGGVYLERNGGTAPYDEAFFLLKGKSGGGGQVRSITGAVDGLKITNLDSTATYMTIRNGSVGVGTISPLSKLHILDDRASLIVENPTANDTLNGRETSIIFVGNTSSGTSHALAAIKSYHGSSAANQEGGLSFMYNDGDDTLTPSGTWMQFIDNTAGYGGPYIYVPNNGQIMDFAHGLRLSGSNANYGLIEGDRNLILKANRTYAGNMTFLTGTTERMRITNNGDTGIGTATPTQKLEVNGSVNVSGTDAQLWVNGSLVCTKANHECPGDSGLIADGVYLYNDSAVMYFNETKLNATIDARASGTSDGNNYTTGVSVSGTTTKNISISIFGRPNISATFTDIDTDTYNTTDQMRAATNNTLNALTLGGQTSTFYLNTSTNLVNASASDVNVSGAYNALNLILKNSGVTAGVYGNGSLVPAITVDAKGRITSVTNITIAYATASGTAKALASDPTDCGANTWANAISAAGALTCSAVTYSGITAMTAANFNTLISDTDPLYLTTAFGNASGDVNVTGHYNDLSLVLASTAVTPGVYGSGTKIPSFTVDAKGRITAASNNTIIESDPLLTANLSSTLTAKNIEASGNLSVNGTNGLNISGTGACVYLPGGGALCGNTTCSWLNSPDGLTMLKVANNGTSC